MIIFRAFIVATRIGELMEQSDIKYQDFQIIDAKHPDIARRDYDKINNCEYYCGEVIGEIVGNTVFIGKNCCAQINCKEISKLMSDIGHEMTRIYIMPMDIYDFEIIKYIVGLEQELEHNHVFTYIRIIGDISEELAKESYSKLNSSLISHLDESKVKIIGYIICNIPFIKRDYATNILYNDDLPFNIKIAEFID